MQLPDEQQHELGHRLGDTAQQGPVHPPAEVAERHRDHRGARVGRGKRVGGQAHDHRVARRVVGGQGAVGGEDERGARSGARVERRQPRPLRRRGVERRLVAVPAGVPELATPERLRQRQLQRVEDHDDPGRGRDRVAQQPRVHSREPRHDGLGHPPVGPERDATALDGNRAGGAQEVARLVFEDEPVEGARQQQEDRGVAHGG